MWQVNWKRDSTDTKCPLCEESEDTEHVLECLKAIKFTQREWEEITRIYRKCKKKREFAVIQVQDQSKIIRGCPYGGELDHLGEISPSLRNSSKKYICSYEK